MCVQVVFVFIVNAYNDETVSRKHDSCAPLQMYLSYYLAFTSLTTNHAVAG